MTIESINALTTTNAFDTVDLLKTVITKETKLYDDQVTLTFNPNSRRKRYAVSDTATGELSTQIPGVTSVLGVINKDQLKQWAADKASTHWLEQENYDNPKAIHKAARVAYLTYSKSATDLGSLVHYGTEVYDATGDTLHFVDNRANEMLARYIDWRKNTSWRVKSIEQLVYSRIHKYAGTLDRLFELPDGRTCLMDVKTSKVSAFSQKGMYDDYPIQLGGYAIALEEMGIHVDVACIVNPDKEFGEFHVHMLDDEAFEIGKQAWLATLQLYNLHNLCKYHAKKQNSMKTGHWYATHKKD